MKENIENLKLKNQILQDVFTECMSNRVQNDYALQTLELACDPEDPMILRLGNNMVQWTGCMSQSLETWAMILWYS